MTKHRSAFALSLLTGFMLLVGASAFAAPSVETMDNAPTETGAASAKTPSATITLAQAQPAPPPSTTPAPAAASPDTSDDPIGNVATLTGTASVIRNKVPTPLKLQDDIYLNDIVQTSVNSTLGVTFNDATTFNLTANARMTIDNYIYEDGGKQNAATFNIIKGTVAFAAAAVAKTGDMKISTPTATLGIRGTTGLVEVPQGAVSPGGPGAPGGAGAPGATPSNVGIKLYPDADGHVGHIDVSGRDGSRLGSLTQGASGFTIRPGANGRYSAAPLAISPLQAQRDQGIVRQVHAAQTVGRQIVTQKRAQRAANPNRNNQRNNPGSNPARQGGQRPGQPQPGVQRQGGQPGLQRPAAPNRPALQRRAAPKAKPGKSRR